MKESKRIQFTKQGYDEVQKEKVELEENRKKAVLLLKTAREMGDLSENSAYRAARFKLSQIDYRLRHLNRISDAAKIIERTTNDIVEIGCSLEVEHNGEIISYQIVNEFEMNLEKGKLSFKSPIGRSFLGKKKGEHIEVHTPAGIMKYTILKIK